MMKPATIHHTIRVSPTLHKQVRDRSDETGIKMQRIVEDALREYLEKRKDVKAA
jgi:hypothetical protein